MLTILLFGICLMSQFLFNIAVNTEQLLVVNVQTFLELFEISMEKYCVLLITSCSVMMWNTSSSLRRFSSCIICTLARS